MDERTTVTADADDLAVLRDEARRRGVSLSSILRQAVSQQAAAVRARRRPRIGIGHSGSGAARAASQHPDEPYEATPPKAQP